MEVEPWKRVQALYETALQLDPEKRDEFLLRFCGDDRAIRELVESMLRERDRSGSDVLPSPPVRKDAFIGATVGAYEIREKLGQGGMGLVYKALQKRLSRWVALKVLPFEKSGDPTQRQRFLQEARTASALNHPHIVTIHDIVTMDYIDYIVMEYVEGTTLDDRIPAGGLPIEEAVRYAVQLADALGAAHAKGVIHRDLKPSNIMVTDTGVVKVLDFGLAKLQAKGLQAAAPLTEEGTVVGTLEYMSPEQAEGKPVDARTDIFSLGVVLYEMLTGMRPFRGPSQPSVLHAICFDAPAPPEQLRSEIPGELAAMVQRCLAKTPAARYASAAKLETELLDLKKELSLSSDASDDRTATRVRPATDRATPEPATAFSRRSRWGLAGAFLITGAAGLLGYWTLHYRAGRDALESAPSAAPSLTDAREDGVTPYALYNDGRTYLARPDQKGSVDRAITLFERAVERDETYPAAHAGLAAAYREKFVWSSRDPLWLERAVASAQHAVELDPLLAVAHAELGLALAEKGELREARAALEEALRLDPKSADAQWGLAVASRSSGQTSDAEEHFRKAIDARPDDWRLRSAFGEFLFEQARYEEAETVYRHVLELTPDNFVGWESLAAALHMQGRSADAAGALQRALEIQPDANTYSNLGTLLYFEARYSDAAAAFEQAVELRPNQYLFWANLGDAYRWVPGSETKARDAFERAIQLLRQALNANPSDRALRARLGEYLAKVGDSDGALQVLAELEKEPNNSPDTWFVLTKAYELCGERERALEALSKALEGGYSIEEVKQEPELLDLRQDVRYHRLILPWDAERG